MKRTFIFALSAALMFAAVSCQEKIVSVEGLENQSNDNVALVKTSFDVTITKTSLSGDAAIGLAPVWNAGDKIAVFDNVNPGTAHEFEASTTGANVKFYGEVSAGATEFYAVYPYTSSASISDGKITVSLPEAQVAAAGQVDPAAMYAVAHTKNSSLDFKQVEALMSLTFDKADAVNSFYIEGMNLEKIAGAAEIVVSDNPSATVSGISRITVTPASGEVFEGTYYVAIPAVNFEKGFRAVFRSAEQPLSMSRTSSKALNLSRKNVVKLGNIVTGNKWNGIETAEQLRSFLDKDTGIGVSFEKGDIVELLENVSLVDGSKRDGLDATFVATFEGNNHTINIEYQGAPSQNALFKSTNGAVLQNLYLTGYRTSKNRDTKDQTIASLVGKPYNTTIINCHSSMDLTHTFDLAATAYDGNALIGGLVAYVYENLTIKNCSYTGNMTFNSGSAGYGCLMGGIAGFTKAYADGAKRIIENCTVSGNVILNQNITSKWCHYGGFISQPKLTTQLFTSADQADLLTIKDCRSSVNVVVKGATKSRVGGFIADCYGAFYLENNIFDGSISYESTNNGGEHLAAGMYPYCEAAASGYVHNCTYDGNISNEGGNGEVKYWLGGVVGNGMNAATVIDGCTVTARAVVNKVKGMESTPEKVNGSCGLVSGRPNNAITIKNCKVAGYAYDLDLKLGVNIDSQSTLDANEWVLKGSNTTAAVILSNNIYNSEK